MMLENRMKQIGNILFYTVLLIELGIVIVDKSAYINPIEGRLFQITFLLCVMKIVMTEYSLKEWIIMAAFFALGVVSYYVTGRNEIIRIAAFIAASKNIELRPVMKTTFYVTLAGVVSLIMLSLTGIMGWIFLEVDYGRGGIEKRYCLGLGHPNALHCMIWALIVLGIYLYWERLKWYHYVVMEAVNIGFYLLTLSRTGMAVATVSILIAAVLCVFSKLQKNKWLYILGGIGVGCCVIFSILAALYGCSISLFAWADKYLTGRILWSWFHGGTAHWSLFSNADEVVYIDMGFIRLFYWYGIIPGIVYIIVKGFQLFYCFKKKDAAAFLVITMFALYTVFEAHAISVYMLRDYALLLMVGTWSGMFGIESENEGYFWQPGKYLKRQY